jgi:hypothetical protein
MALFLAKSGVHRISRRDPISPALHDTKMRYPK